MDRRNFLKFSAAGAVAPYFPSFAPLAQAAPVARLVDAHAHLFNANDLPIVGFVEKVVVAGHAEFEKLVGKYGSSIDFFVRFLADWVRGKAPTAVYEIAEIDRIAANPSLKRSAGKIRSDEIANLTQLIKDLMDARFLKGRMRAGGKLFEKYVPLYVVALMHKEAFPQKYATENAYDPETWEQPGNLAKQLYDVGNGDFGRYLRWALQLTRYRFELLDVLTTIHGGRMKLALPAIIDFSKWVGDDFDVKIVDQMRVMGKIAAMKGGPRTHFYMTFDPLREALHRLKAEGALSPLEAVKEAVLKQGAIGVKMYPPMGFYPLGNKGKPNTDYPKALVKIFAKAKKPVGEALDEALNDFYAFCKDKNVPIIAHAAESNGSAPGYEKRADPALWAPVLKAYPGLHLNLAHFGHFDHYFKAKNAKKAKLADTWEWKLAQLAKDHPECKVYGDLGYTTFALLKDPNNQKPKETARMLGEIRKAFPFMGQRILFGSDWFMLGQEKLFAASSTGGQLAAQMDEILIKAGFTDAERDGIMFKNAGAFLGIDKKDAKGGNRERLTDFYKTHSLDAGWMKDFES